MRIESLRLRNFKVFRNVEIRDIPALSVFLGANGSGKSTLFDVFGFLRDALVHNVRQALAKRGGFREVVSRGQSGPIEIELKFRDASGPLVTYTLAISEDGEKHPYVAREILKYRRGSHGQPWKFLDFSNGQGDAITNEEQSETEGAEARRERQQLDSPDILAIKGLGQFQKFQKASALRKLIENWHVSDFHIDDARPSQEAGFAEHLSQKGDNLPLVAQFLHEQHPQKFAHVLEKMKQRVPGVSHVEADLTTDGRIVLKFQDGGFKDPFVARYVSDGTIKMFAYLLLLHDPSPHPLLCVEEPENQLYPVLLMELAEEFRAYAERGGQVFVSTHSPDFLNGIRIEEIFWLEKKEGYSIVKRASSNATLRGLVEQGDLPGWLWKQGLLGGIGPK
jgi:predicted ATPase